MANKLQGVRQSRTRPDERRRGARLGNKGFQDRIDNAGSDFPRGNLTPNYDQQIRKSSATRTECGQSQKVAIDRESEALVIPLKPDTGHSYVMA